MLDIDSIVVTMKILLNDHKITLDFLQSSQIDCSYYPTYTIAYPTGKISMLENCSLRNYLHI